MKKYSITLLVLAMLCLPFGVNAWSMIGHRIIGQIAENHLSGKSKKAVLAILGTESLAMASNWGDLIKSDSKYDSLYNWHFVNLPAGLSQEKVFSYLETEKEPNVYNKSLEMIRILKGKQSSPDQKKFALRMLIHMVGDLNQPMHTARKEDLGGNKIYVTWFGEKSNLHRVWDDELIDYQKLSYTEFAAAIDYPTKQELISWKAKSLKEYVYGSYDVCSKIYETTKPEAKLSYKYNFDYVDTLNDQLLKGGICLANILNDTFK
ncbi:MAG: S1/P1 nuclease [Pedobacter sp.]